MGRLCCTGEAFFDFRKTPWKYHPGGEGPAKDIPRGFGRVRVWDSPADSNRMRTPKSKGLRARAPDMQVKDLWARRPDRAEGGYEKKKVIREGVGRQR